MSEEVQIDQETFDKAIAAGKSERVARAMAKSAWVRKTKGPAGPGEKKADAPAEVPAEAPAAAPAGAPSATPAAAPAATAVQERLTPEQRAARVAAATGKAPVTDGNGAADGTQRLLAVVPPEGIQRTTKRQDDKVNVWPHLLAAEFLSLLLMTVFLLAFSTFKDAPFRELANPNLTPNPSKAPWYFLGLQELLRYFHPMVAGVTIPGLGLFGLMALPYADKNPSVKPERRKLAIVLFTIFMMMWCVLVILGVMFRGPGYNFIWPWNTGVFFDL